MSTLASTPSPTVAAISDLDHNAKLYRAARDVVSERVSELDAEIAALYRRKLPGIKSAIAAAKTAQDAAAAAVQRHTFIFQKPNPRTMVLHGIKVGLAKGAGKVTWEMEDDVLIGRIERMFAGEPETLELLIVTEKSPSKDALKKLEAKILAKLGVEVEGVGDYVVVADSDTEAKKLVKRILKEGAIHEVETETAAK